MTIEANFQPVHSGGGQLLEPSKHIANAQLPRLRLVFRYGSWAPEEGGRGGSRKALRQLASANAKTYDLKMLAVKSTEGPQHCTGFWFPQWQKLPGPSAEQIIGVHEEVVSDEN